MKFELFSNGSLSSTSDLLITHKKYDSLINFANLLPYSASLSSIQKLANDNVRKSKDKNDIAFVNLPKIFKVNDYSKKNIPEDLQLFEKRIQCIF